jgi:tRNA nucleotidyltransferase/poly(A) polymerase
MRGALHEDLLARDLTINAIAFPAGAGEGWASALVDPAGGREDLAQRQIRFVRPDAPERDPLRVLRALRLAWKLGFTLPPDTEAIARTCVPKLDRVSGERIRDEWFQLLALPSPTPAVGQAMDWGLGPWTLGCGAGANVGRVAGALGALLSQPELQTPEVSEWLDRSVTAGRSRRQLLAHAAALLAVEPPVAAEESARRLALSSDEKQILARGAAARDTAAALLAAWPVPGRHRLRFRLAAGGAAPEAVLLTPRDQGCGARATLLQETLTCSLNPPEPLITGGALIRALGLAPGPRVGRLLREIEEARADGLLTTGDQAVAWARERVAGDTPSSGRS